MFYRCLNSMFDYCDGKPTLRVEPQMKVILQHSPAGSVLVIIRPVLRGSYLVNFILRLQKRSL